MGNTYTLSQVASGEYPIDWYSDKIVRDVQTSEDALTSTGIDVSVHSVQSSEQSIKKEKPPIEWMLRNSRHLTQGANPYVQLYTDTDDFADVEDYDSVYKKYVSDKGGAFSSRLGGKLGFLGGTLAGNFGIGSVISGSPDVLDPVTGKRTTRLNGPFGIVHDMLLKNKYEGVKKIKSAYAAGGKNIPAGLSWGQYHASSFLDWGNVLRIGNQTFVRKPGEYNFYGNMAAVGVDTKTMHNIVALQQGKDPKDYDWRNSKDTGTKVLGYGGAGAYRLDGRHVDYTGQLASAGIGMSHEFEAMADRYFNGNYTIAREWLAGAHKFKTFTGTYKDKDAMIAHFENYVKMAGGDVGGGGAISRTPGHFNTQGEWVSKSVAVDEPVAVDTDDYAGMDLLTTEDASEVTEDPFKTEFVSPNVNLTYPSVKIDMLGWDEIEATTLGNKASADTSALVGAVDFDVNAWARKVANNLNNPNRVTFTPADPALSKTTGQLQHVSEPTDLQKAAQSAIQLSDPATYSMAEREKADRKRQEATVTAVADVKSKVDTGATKLESWGRYGFKEGGVIQDFWTKYTPIGMQFGGQPAEVADIPTDPTGTVTGPVGFVEAPPSQVPEAQTVADNQASALPPDSFVLNAGAVKLRGEKDVKSMLMDAYYEARRRGLPIGNVDAPLYSGNVDVLLSKGEVVIPPELVDIIGLGKLEKLNNRGKRKVKDITEKTEKRVMGNERKQEKFN